MKNFQYLPEVQNDTIFALVGSPLSLPACFLVLVNLWAFFLMAFDKRRAKRPGARRIRERTLFLSALLGGALGATLGMWIFRHKTKHWYFAWGLPILLLAQLGLIGWICYSIL